MLNNDYYIVELSENFNHVVVNVKQVLQVVPVWRAKSGVRWMFLDVYLSQDKNTSLKQ